jgi:hypothetical protein
MTKKRADSTSVETALVSSSTVFRPHILGDPIELAPAWPTPA